MEELEIKLREVLLAALNLMLERLTHDPTGFKDEDLQELINTFSPYVLERIASSVSSVDFPRKE